MGTQYAGDDNDSYFDELFLKVWQDESCLNLLGDLNQDAIINILDVLVVINAIINGEGDDILSCGDMNNDNTLNILDIVIIVDLILAE